MNATALIATLAGLAAVLIIASLLDAALAHKRGDAEAGPTAEGLSARISSSWAMLGAYAFACLFGAPGIILLFALLSFAVLREFMTLTTKDRGDHWVLVAVFFLVLPMQYALIWTDWYGFASIFIPAYVFLALPIISTLRGRADNILIRVSETQWALMLSVYCLSYAPALLLLDIPGYEGGGPILIAWLFLIVALSDVAQLLWTRAVGLRPIAPTLSPSRTWEGLILGAATAALPGAILYKLTPFNPWAAGLLALVVAVLSASGTLVLTAIKRDRGVRDWGHLIDGNGGFLDRLDGVIFAAPIFFHLTRYFYVP